ncbi:NAD(P)-dependent alcohol dehydrogenase [Nonomuraea sp. bgisy101]|uniref:NAD(P)-dependent alcohol dehydrogenase n=1 Tax=Nonomuraea sp. bgisy101 TaxID=3413784 RepID=UPI003D75812D
MKAMVRETYCSPDLLRLADIDRPVAGDDDVLVRVVAAGVDQGVWHLITGLPYLSRLASGPFRPRHRVPGLDVAGRVEAVGANVTRFRPGDEVYGTCDGSFAEYARTSEDRLDHKPANLTFEQAAAVPTSAFPALQGVRPVQAGQRVLVIGAGGGVGTFAVQLATAFGADVTGVCSTAKADLVRSLGADVVDYTREDFADGAHHYDLIVDTAGHRTLSHLRRALTPTGTLVVIGSEVKGRWLQGTDRQLRMFLLSPFVRQKLRPLFSTARQEDLRLLTKLLASGQVTPIIARTYPLDEVAEAVRYLRSGQAAGKIVITV